MEGILDETFDRIVNCPLCGGSLECWYYKYVTDVNWSEAYINVRNDHGEVEDRYTWRKVTCPLCDGTGTALARITATTGSCKKCGGRGSVETTVRLDVGARKESVQCSACQGKGTLTQEQIEIQTFKNAGKSCYIYLPEFHSIDGGHTTFDLEGGAKTFFSKWQPASQSAYLRERRESARQEAQPTKQQEELRIQDEKKKRELVEDRIRQGLCVTCGGALGFFDQMSGRKYHKRCP